MELKRALSIALVSAVAIVSGLTALGCGDANGEGDGQSQADSPSGQAGQTETEARPENEGQNQNTQAKSEAPKQKGPTEVQPSAAFVRVLSDLKDAALSDQAYRAIRKSNSLDRQEEVVIDAFCETAWQLEINKETGRLSNPYYMVGRIRNLAEFNLSSPDTAAVTGAMTKLRATVDLPSLDKELNSRYKRACYRK
jgi:hypothetical protein